MNKEIQIIFHSFVHMDCYKIVNKQTLQNFSHKSSKRGNTERKTATHQSGIFGGIHSPVGRLGPEVDKGRGPMPSGQRRGEATK